MISWTKMTAMRVAKQAVTLRTAKMAKEMRKGNLRRQKEACALSLKDLRYMNGAKRSMRCARVHYLLKQ